MFIEKALLIPKGLCGPFEVAYWNPRVGAAKDSPPYGAYSQWGVNLEFC